MEHLTEIIIPVAFFAMVFLIVYFTSKYNYKLKQAIIEKGGNVELTRKKFPLIELGAVILGIGLGLGLAIIPQSMSISEDTKDLFTGALVLIFGGAGLVSAFFIRRKIENK